MGTKVKGLLKGLRYISHMFDEEKEKEIQIGFPTDVKHVGHIGWDGPSADTPSWMNDFKSAPLNSPVDSREDTEIQWVSEDSRRRNKSAPNSPGHDGPEQPKSTRCNSSSEKSSSDSPKKKDSSSKSRHSRRHHSKDSGEGSGKSTRHLQDSSLGTDSPPPDLPDIPKKSRRKKSKESVGDGSSRRSKHKDSEGSSRSRTKGGTSSGTYTSPSSDPGAETGPVTRTLGSQPSAIPSIDDQEKGLSIISKDC